MHPILKQDVMRIPHPDHSILHPGITKHPACPNCPSWLTLCRLTNPHRRKPSGPNSLPSDVTISVLNHSPYIAVYNKPPAVPLPANSTNREFRRTAIKLVLPNISKLRGKTGYQLRQKHDWFTNHPDQVIHDAPDGPRAARRPPRPAFPPHKLPPQPVPAVTALLALNQQEVSGDADKPALFSDGNKSDCLSGLMTMPTGSRLSVAPVGQDSDPEPSNQEVALQQSGKDREGVLNTGLDVDQL